MYVVTRTIVDVEGDISPSSVVYECKGNESADEIIKDEIGMFLNPNRDKSFVGELRYVKYDKDNMRAVLRTDYNTIVLAATETVEKELYYHEHKSNGMGR